MNGRSDLFGLQESHRYQGRVCFRKGIRHIPAFLKKLYEIRNTLRKEAEVSGNKKLFVKADEVSDKIKELSIKASRRRWESFCSAIQLEKWE